MWRLIDDTNISTNIIYDLFDGVESDLKERVEFKTEKELLIYSYRVAGTVGLMMAKILKVKKEIAFKAAIDLGIAMQLTNISRDVIEDQNLNRHYINPEIEKILETLDLAESFYKSCFYSIKEIPFRLRFSICVARRVYRKIGHKIKNKKDFNEYEKSGKIFVSNFGKIAQTFISLLDLIELSFTKEPKIHETENKHKVIMEEINLNERF